MLREPFVIPFAGFATGILLSNWTQFAPWELVLGGVALAAVALVARVRKCRILNIAATALAMVASAVLVVFALATLLATMLSAANARSPSSARIS